MRHALIHDRAAAPVVHILDIPYTLVRKPVFQRLHSLFGVHRTEAPLQKQDLMLTRVGFATVRVDDRTP